MPFLKNIKSTAILFIIILVSGCGTSTTGTGTQFTLEKANSKTATIYHYREKNFMGGGRIHLVISNNKPLIEIGNGGYYKQVTQAGTNIYKSKIESRTGIYGSLLNIISDSFEDFDERLKLTVKAGKRYFVRWGPTIAEEVNSKEGLKEISNLKAFTIDVK